MIGLGRNAVKMLKQNIIENYKELILYKPVGNMNLHGMYLGFCYDCVPSN